MAKVLMKGNEAIGEAAIRAGCLNYFAYPITPQSEVAEYLSRRMEEAGGVFLQGESEVAVSYMIFGAAGCAACHKLDGPDKLVGPSLWDIGAKKDKEYIRESILEPDKIVTEGFPKGVMKATLDGQQFYQNISIDTLDKLVEYLAGLKGKS